MRKALFTLAAVVTTSIMTTVMIVDAQAGHTETKELKCEEMVGSFYNPLAGSGHVYTSSHGKCNNLGETTLTSVVGPTGIAADLCEDDTDGLYLASPAGLPGWALSEKGFIVSTTSGLQCFYNGDGDPIDAPPVGFCGDAGTNAYTSSFVGEIVIIGGIVDKHVVVGGDAEFESWNEHCAGIAAPYGNFGTSSIEGEIETRKNESGVPEIWFELFNQ